MAYKNKDGIWVVSDSIDCNRYSFDTTAESLKEYIDSIVVDAISKGMVDEGTFDFAIENSYYEIIHELRVRYYFNRTENDKERSTREAAEATVKAEAAAKRKAAAEKKKLKNDAEYQEFLRLKEKFGAIEK
jgi:hypothetical protein